MGTFLMVSSVVGATGPEVEACISAYAASRRGVLERFDGPLPDNEGSRLLQSAGGVTFVYPDGFTEWEDVSSKLSVDLNKPAFAFHIHDGDLWMFVLFVNGKEAVKFNPIPGYWEELGPEERGTWLPSADAVTRHVPSAKSAELAPYLVEWPPEGIEGKAHPDDEFEYIDWQLVDFMRRLGFRYPEPTEGVSYRFKVRRL